MELDRDSKVVTCLALILATASPALAGGIYTQLYAFTGGADGADSLAVTLDAAGNIYGETGSGAQNCPSVQFGSQNLGCGTLYKLTPGGKITVLQTFIGSNGAAGDATPAVVGNSLYGSTYLGGASNQGVVFSISTDGTGFRLLHQFAGRDGAFPRGPMIPATGGGVYGLTFGGGYDKGNPYGGSGTLFKIGPNGRLLTLHAFHGGDGANPSTLIMGSNGTLYGSTWGGGGAGICSGGCGTVFSYVPATATFTTLYAFSGRRDGDSPELGSVDANGTLYGTTGTGGPYHQGTLFSLTTAAPYSLTLLHGFGKGNGPDGAEPSSGPTLLPNNTLIGTTIDSLYFFDPNLAHNGTELLALDLSSSIEPQPTLAPHGKVIGPIESGGTTPCIAGNGQTINAFGCGVIYSESYSK